MNTVALLKSPDSRENSFINSEIDFEELSLQEIMSTPKYIGFLAELKTTFKTELHAHLGGAVSKEFIEKYSTRQQYEEFTGFVEKLKNGIDYTEGFKAFPMIGRVLNTNKRIEEAAYDFCKSQHADNVTFAELRTGLKRLDGGFEDYLTAVLAGLEKGMIDYPIQVTLLLSLQRITSSDDANEIIELTIKHRGKILTGIDVSGESIKGDASGIYKALQIARSNGLPITLHIGENKLETPEQQLKELTEIRPTRVGHAVFISPKVSEWIIDNQIVVEFCLRSALSVMITKPKEHPALALIKMKHPVVICTDDPTLFGDLSEELALVACLCNLSLDEVVEMQKKARTYAFK
jgi:adenosine deaminase